MKSQKFIFFLFSLILGQYVCSNANNVTTSQNDIIADSDFIGISGISDSEKVTLVSSTGEAIDLAGNGDLYLAGTLIRAWSIASPEILSSPDGKTCTLNNNPPSEPYIINITCVPVQYFSIGGTLTGTTGSVPGIRLNDFVVYYPQADGTFAFPDFLTENSAYEVSIVSQPSDGKLCSVNHATGTATVNVNNIEIFCASDVYIVSGNLSQHNPGLSLKNSNGEILQIASDATTFTFEQFLPYGTNFEISIESQPERQQCYALNNRGRITGNVTDIQITCNHLLNLDIALSVDENLLPDTPATLELWFYTDRNQIVYPALKRSVEFIKGSVYRLQIPDEHFYVRAFLDVNENHLPEPGIEPQSIVYDLQTLLTDNRLDITLDNTLNDSRLQNFNAYMFNTSPWYQPGGGKCGGIFLKLEASGFSGQKAHLSSVYVILPDFTLVELLDDGGCGDSFNNNSSSYDNQSGDMQLSAGIDVSFPIYTGKYTFYYINYVTGKIHIAEDTLSTVDPMSSNITLINPSGAAALQNPRPAFQWNAIPGAKSYEILLESADHIINNFSDPFRFAQVTYYQLPFDLIDNQSYRVNIQAFDTDLSGENPDFDNVAQGPDNYFITDFTGQKSILVSGKIINQSGAYGSFMIYGSSNTDHGNWVSSAVVPSESESYSLAVFKNTGKYGAMIAGINADQSGYINSEINKDYVKTNSSILLSQNLTLDLVWNRPLLQVSPLNEQKRLGDYPVFSWENFLSDLNEPASYILWITPHLSSDPPVIIGLRDNSFDLGQPEIRSYYNLTDTYLCQINSATSQDAYNQCPQNNENIQPSGLGSHIRWEWKVLAVPCNFHDYTNQTDMDHNGRPDYNDCIIKSFTGEIPASAESISRLFSTY